jgi:hypothetical protein
MTSDGCRRLPLRISAGDRRRGKTRAVRGTTKRSAAGGGRMGRRDDDQSGQIARHTPAERPEPRADTGSVSGTPMPLEQQNTSEIHVKSPRIAGALRFDREVFAMTSFAVMRGGVRRCN